MMSLVFNECDDDASDDVTATVGMAVLKYVLERHSINIK